MTKSIRQAIIKRSELGNSILKIGPLKIKINRRNKRTFVVNFIIKTEKFHSNLELNQIINDKRFWRTINPLFSDKYIQSSAKTLVSKISLLTLN